MIYYCGTALRVTSKLPHRRLYGVPARMIHRPQFFARHPNWTGKVTSTNARVQSGTKVSQLGGHLATWRSLVAWAGPSKNDK